MINEISRCKGIGWVCRGRQSRKAMQKGSRQANEGELGELRVEDVRQPHKNMYRVEREMNDNDAGSFKTHQDSHHQGNSKK